MKIIETLETLETLDILMEMHMPSKHFGLSMIINNNPEMISNFIESTKTDWLLVFLLLASILSLSRSSSLFYEMIYRRALICIGGNPFRLS